MAKRDRREEIDELKELYEKARKKYDLPDFDELDREFELRKIEDGFVISEVRKTILDKIHAFTNWIEPVINPHQHSIHSIVESRVFNKAETDEVFNFYKKLYYHLHRGLLAGLQSEKHEAEFIKEIWKIYPELKKEITKFIEKITKSWQEAEEEYTPDEYHG